MSHYQIS